jgi:hypothetical protein
MPTHHLGIPGWAQQLQRGIVSVLPKVELPGMARVSFGIDNGPADVDLLVRVLGQVAAEGSARRKELKRQIEGFVEDAVRRVYGEAGRRRAPHPAIGTAPAGLPSRRQLPMPVCIGAT